MYCPAHFVESRIDVMHALIAARPLATLVTMTTDGLNADHIPLTLSADPAPFGTLRGHVARANPMWKTLRAEIEALAVFHGPACYISPTWYPEKKKSGKAVPTWNYVTVHARGALRIIEDKAWLRQQVESLTQQQEQTLAEPWFVSDAPADYIDNMLGAIIGIEMNISCLSGKWKVSQNQPATNRAGAVLGLHALGGDDALSMAGLIEAGF